MAVGQVVLIDTSAWVQMGYSDIAEARVQDLRRKGLLAICGITRAELLYSARNRAEMQGRIRDLDGLIQLRVTGAVERQVTESMLALAERGHHRRSIPDLIVAAVAWTFNTVVLHYDKDFDLIADVTGQPTEWIVERGTGHGSV